MHERVVAVLFCRFPHGVWALDYFINPLEQMDLSALFWGTSYRGELAGGWCGEIELIDDDLFFTYRSCHRPSGLRLRFCIYLRP